MKPTIGRITHYTSFGTPGGEHLPEPRAAIITAVHSDEDVALAILNPTGLFFSVDVPYSETPKAGHWNWPPREPNPGDIGILHADGSHEYMKPKGKKKKGKSADSTGHQRDRSSGKFTGGRVVNVGGAFGSSVEGANPSVGSGVTAITIRGALGAAESNLRGHPGRYLR